MKIVLIGTGNVAVQTGKNLTAIGFSVLQVYGRSAGKAEKLAKILNCSFVTDINGISKNADLYIIAVSDKAVEEIASVFEHEKAVVVHTAGSVDMNVLKNCSPNIGVVYPLQTITSGLDISFSGVPLCIEANNEISEKIISRLATGLSNHVYKVDSEKRKYLHVAGVMVNNFTNFMYAMAKELSDKKGFDFEILKPLIIETANKILMADPGTVQTGPAIRNDLQTLSKHINLLDDFPDHQKIYSFVTSCIQDYYLKNK